LRGSVDRSGIDWSSSGRSLVGWGRVGGCNVEGRVVFGVVGFAYVLDISNIAIAICLVSNDLSATVGKEDTVGSGGYFTITALRMRIIVGGRMRIVTIGASILNGPLKAVGLSNL
jgi:hypothetical protein